MAGADRITRGQRLARIVDPVALAQVGALLVFWLLGAALVRLLQLPLPPGVAGFCILLLLLALGWIPPGFVQRGATWLLARMLVFFVPALLTVLEHPQFIGWLGLRILFVLVAGTALVMAVTAAVVCLAQRWWGREESRAA